MTTNGDQQPTIRSLILDPDLGPVELHHGELTTVTSVFGSDETSPWRATRPVHD